MRVLVVCFLSAAIANALPSQLEQLQEPEQSESPVIGNRIIEVVYPRQSSASSSSSGSSWTPFQQALSILFPAAGNAPLGCETRDSGTYASGSCVSIGDCIYYGGTNLGACAGGLGYCCVFPKKCEETTDRHISHFVNPSYNTLSVGSGECKLTVNPMHSNICQHRLDFDVFEIMGPESSSNCVDDFFGVTGGTAVQKMCGVMTGQHIYVSVKPGGGPIVLTMDTSSVKPFARKWNIRVTQISCNSPDKAPAGCLQFFNETSGSVKSFNFFPRSSTPEADDQGQIHNSNYGVCINPKVGYCDVTWTQASPYSFTVSGDATQSPGVSLVGTKECKTDFITIPGGKYEKKNRTLVPAERFCGTKFPDEVKTSAQPYSLYVVTNPDEDGDLGNLGFELNFRQNLCHN